MLKKLFAVSLLVLLSSCSAMDVVKEGAKAALGGAKPGLELRANLGKGEAEGDQSIAQNANTALSGQVNETSNETFEGPVGQVTNEAGLKIHELLLLVLLAGWAIPSPAEMLYGVVRATRRTFRIARGVEA
jgi:hypothetical protein